MYTQIYNIIWLAIWQNTLKLCDLYAAKVDEHFGEFNIFCDGII